MAKKDNREPRDTEEFEDDDLLTPFDVTKLGTDEDPCFGKLYDLKAEECKICGDIEVCSIAFSQKLTEKRLNIESETKFKDLEEVKYVSGEDPIGEDPEVLAFIIRQRQAGIPRITIKKLLKSRYLLSDERIKTLINK